MENFNLIYGMHDMFSPFMYGMRKSRYISYWPPKPPPPPPKRCPDCTRLWATCHGGCYKFIVNVKKRERTERRKRQWIGNKVCNGKKNGSNNRTNQPTNRPRHPNRRH